MSYLTDFCPYVAFGSLPNPKLLSRTISVSFSVGGQAAGIEGRRVFSATRTTGLGLEGWLLCVVLSVSPFSVQQSMTVHSFNCVRGDVD